MRRRTPKSVPGGSRERLCSKSYSLFFDDYARVDPDYICSEVLFMYYINFSIDILLLVKINFSLVCTTKIERCSPCYRSGIKDCWSVVF